MDVLKIAVFVVFSIATLGASFAEDETRLIYPTAAAETELDNSTPAKRITPPVREDGEYDPVTPIGQIRAVLEALDSLRVQQETIAARVEKLHTTDDKELLGLLERGAKDRDAISSNVDAILETSKGIVAKIDAIQKTTADLRATVESVEKTAASVERIRTSRWTDAAVVAILALVLIQLAWKVGAVVVDGIKRRAAQYQEFAAFIREKQQAENGANK